MENSKKEILPENVLINTYFLLQLAANKVLTVAENISKSKGVVLKHDIKYNHSLIMDCTKRLKSLHERQIENTTVLNTENYDALLKDTLYYIRLLLRLGDRANRDESVMDKLEQELKSLPSNDIISDEFIAEYFNFKE